MKEIRRVERVKMALAQVDQAERNARMLIFECYPVGSQISWDKGGHVQYGTVVGNSDFKSGDRFRVKNDYTGKTYWITFYDVQLAAPQPRP